MKFGTRLIVVPLCFTAAMVIVTHKSSQPSPAISSMSTVSTLPEPDEPQPVVDTDAEEKLSLDLMAQKVMVLQAVAELQQSFSPTSRAVCGDACIYTAFDKAESRTKRMLVLNGKLLDALRMEQTQMAALKQYQRDHGIPVFQTEAAQSVAESEAAGVLAYERWGKRILVVAAQVRSGTPLDAMTEVNIGEPD